MSSWELWGNHRLHKGWWLHRNPCKFLQFINSFHLFYYMLRRKGIVARSAACDYYPIVALSIIVACSMQLRWKLLVIVNKFLSNICATCTKVWEGDWIFGLGKPRSNIQSPSQTLVQVKNIWPQFINNNYNIYL